ncbi:hypothetical protein TMatcc_001568 [Talaromyces marneffei ATCC 18224]
MPIFESRHKVESAARHWQHCTVDKPWNRYLLITLTSTFHLPEDAAVDLHTTLLFFSALR